MLRTYKTSWFARFARKSRLADCILCDAVRRAQEGLVDADLGGGLIKQRLPRPGAGKSGGYRAILLFRRGELAIYVYGFDKRDLGNISQGELDGFRELAKLMLRLDEVEIEGELRKRSLVEVICCDGQEEFR